MWPDDDFHDADDDEDDLAEVESIVVGHSVPKYRPSCCCCSCNLLLNYLLIRTV